MLGNIFEVGKKKIVSEFPPPPPPPAHQLFQDLRDFRGWRRQLQGILSSLSKYPGAAPV